MDKYIPLTEALFYILLATRKPNHGYGIIQQVQEITGGRLDIGPGTLYGAISSMLEKGWIELYSEEKDSRKKKEYIITREGKSVFQNEVKRLNELVENAKRMEE
ncbi:MAG: PadR family transcriptional regulator [Solirubrobacterales bacterium]